MKLKPLKTKLRIFLVTEFLEGAEFRAENIRLPTMTCWEIETYHLLSIISTDKAFGTHLLLKLHKLVLL